MRTAASIAADVRAGRESAEDIARETLSRLRRLDSKLSAFLSVDEEKTLDEARRVDARLRAGEDLPLAGVPVAVKDNIAVAGRPATCASKILEGFVPGYDATAIDRLRACGVVVAGKTNMDEFAMGSSNENSSRGPVRNPWDIERVPGGSSGGSAASVAARIVPAALGSDTGGSVRQPGSLCGVVGFKPTYGRVSRFGLIAFASSLDQIGPLTLTVEDSARIYAAMAGVDSRDSTTADRDAGDPAAALSRGVRGLRVGILKEALSAGLSAEVERNFKDAVKVLESAGASLSEVSVPRAPYAIPIYYVIANAEASANLARFDGVRYGPRFETPALIDFYVENRTRGFGPEVKRRILLGTFALSAGYAGAYYGRAARARALLSKDFDDAFRQADVIVCPTTPGPAFRIGEKAQDPLAMYLSDIFTTPASLAGLPAISVPSGFSDGLPLGLQILAPRWEEETLFAAAAAYERETRFAQAPAPVSL